MKNFGWPDCAVCGRPVQEMSTSRDETRMVFVVVVRCHGETETAEVEQELLEGFKGFECGKAFVGKALPAVPRELA